MIDIRSMGYVRVASTDLGAWRTFAEKVLGLAVGRGPSEDNLYYRIDEVSARLVVFPSDVDELSATGWELADHDALQQAREHLQKAGVELEEGTADELAERRVQELIRFTDPFDNVFELFHGITYESRPVVTPYAATFVTGDQGMGHIVVPVSDDVEALRFYRDVLGFRLRDSMSMPGEFVGREPGTKVWLRFLGSIRATTRWRSCRCPTRPGASTSCSRSTGSTTSVARSSGCASTRRRSRPRSAGT
jgi:3,4-dihydroxy-9,10-secoandrosta-1,3,5(10)-triene-9,17-dione 4,5-dioxygenase